MVAELPAKPSLSRRRAAIALTVAIATDLLQLPAAVAMLASTAAIFGAPADVPLEGIIAALDIAASIIEIRLLGFHWLLLPTFVLKAVPLADVAPTWTLCVLYLVRRSRRTPRPARFGGP